MREGLKFDGEHMKFEERQESFEKFLSFVKNVERGTDFKEVGNEDTPFGEDW